MERGKKVRIVAANAGGLDDILPPFDDGPPVGARRAVPLGEYRRRMACSLPPVTRHLFLAASLLATPLLPLAMPAHAANITISGPITGNVYGNSSDTVNGSVADQPASGNSVTINTGADVGVGAGIARVIGGSADASIPITGTSANNNTVTMNDGHVISGILGGGASSDSTTATANNNTVTINGGVLSGPGGGGARSSMSSPGMAIANANKVIITGGEITSGPWSGGSAYGYTATASNNIITISNGNAGVFNGGHAQNGTLDGGTATASNNIITISGGTASGVYGGDAYCSASANGTATASGNTVTISGGTINEAIGGSAYIPAMSGTGSVAANRNTVTISGGSVSRITGGETTVEGGSDVATANNNMVIISGGSISGKVSGGSIDVDAIGTHMTATANNNTVIISGGTISGDIAGGYASGGVANNNTVTIEGNADLNINQVKIYGGMGGDYVAVNSWQDRALGDSSITAGNTFNLKRSGVTVAGLYNFENLNFYLPTDLGNGGTMLTVTKEANIDKANVNVGINGASSPLRAGDKVYLIDAGTLTGTPANNNGIVRGSGMQGVTWLYDFKIYTQGNQLIAEIPKEAPPPTVSTPSAPAEPPPVRVNPQAKAVNEGFVAPVTTVNQGLTFSSTKGVDEAVKAADGKGQESGEKGVGGVAGVIQSSAGARPFGAISGSTMTYDTGSSVDVDSISVIAGLSKAIEYQQLGRLTMGGFLEYGHGGYDTYNSFPNQASVHGSGNIDNFGGGVLGRLDLRQLGEGISAGRFYADASARLGQVRSDFSSDLRDMMGTAASFDTDSIYFGGHLGGGYLMAVSNTSQADFYARLLWTHQDGDDVRLSTGETVNFDAVDSLRTMLGLRYTWVAKSWLVPYVGAGWEHEFDGEAGSTVNGIALDKPSLSGDTGMGELGVNMGSNAGKWAFDVGAQGYVGAREGVSGTVRVVYRW